MASADVEGAFDGIKHDDVEKALLQKGVHPESCMLVVVGREAWEALTCGIRYWTAHSENLQVAGKWRE